ADLLTAMGAKITGAGSPRITVEGVERLGGADHEVIPDRIEAGTYVMAAAITRGEVTLDNFPTDCLTAALDRLEQIGVTVVSQTPPDGAYPRRRARVRVHLAERLRPTQVVTQPHPGFPTDLQAQIMTLLSLASGNSIITEKIYPDR